MDGQANQAQVSDHDLLIRIDEKLNNLSDSNKKIDEKLTDHEARIRAEEKHSEMQDGMISGIRSTVFVFNGILVLFIAAIGIYVSVRK